METIDREQIVKILLAATAQPNENSTDDNGAWPASRLVIAASDALWEEQLVRARQMDRDHTLMLAGLGYSNPDRDGQLCAIQCEQRSKGVENVRVSTWLKGWAVRTDWAESHRIFVGYGDDPTEALAAAIRWQHQVPSKRGIRMYGHDYLKALSILTN